jgi:NAD(P)-dependent dehydrogenase (short-subunit alcohol dehydrogenase family)
MKESRRGFIITLSSGAGRRGEANLCAYAASKFAVMGFMESLAAEVGQFGIKCSTILPGSILTDFGPTPLEEKRAQTDRKYLEADDVAGKMEAEHLLRTVGRVGAGLHAAGPGHLRHVRAILLATLYWAGTPVGLIVLLLSPVLGLILAACGNGDDVARSSGALPASGSAAGTAETALPW